MTSAVTAINRVVLVVLGLALAVGGALGLALGFDTFGRAAARRPLLTRDVSRYADRNAWFWWAVAAACILVGILALCWLLAQARTEGIGRVDLTRDGDDGLTSLHAGALTDAVENDIRGVRGVTAARARLRGNRARRLDVVVNLDERADIGQLRDRLRDATVPHTRDVIDDPELPVNVELRPAGRPAQRVE